MSSYNVPDPDFENRVRASFAGQTLMKTIGTSLTEVLPGKVEIQLPYRDDLTQQHGFIHAGIVTTIADTACGYAAYSLMPADAAVLTVEYKVNLLSPAEGDFLAARGQVTKTGRTLTVCKADVSAVTQGQEKVIAIMLATMMAIKNREGLIG